MTDHLPECPCVNKSAHPDGCLCCEISSPCICDRLRACEQRVLEQNSRAFDVAVIAHLMKEERAAGLDAAREAVKVLRHRYRLIWPTDEGAMQALNATIDALRLPAEP